LIAKNLQNKKKISNVRFQQGSYMKTSYLKNSFDRIFALESVIYSPNKKEYIKEMYRILKPNGKIVILDIFPKKYLLISLTNKIDNYLFKRKISDKNIKNYYVDIENFLRILKSEKFIEIKIHNLLSSGNIKKFKLFQSIFLSSFALLISKLKSIYKIKSNKFKLIFPFIIFILITYKFFMDITSYEYYSIEAVKNLV
jgi:ubiquinone/menaquinone biosynthesis C-methylase UbiE